jgi:hypothetical protein
MDLTDFDLIDRANELARNLRIVIQLNKLFSIDPDLTKNLVNARHQVSKAYTEAEEFVYQQDKDEDPPVAGLIGILNGLIIDTDKYRLAANYDNDELIGFCLLKMVNGKLVKA